MQSTQRPPSPEGTHVQLSAQAESGARGFSPQIEENVCISRHPVMSGSHQQSAVYTISATCVHQPWGMSKVVTAHSTVCTNAARHVCLRKGEQIWRMQTEPVAHTCAHGATPGAAHTLHPQQTDGIYSTE